MVVIGGKGVPFPCEKTLKVSKLEVLYIMLYFMLFDLGENSNWRKPEECKSLKIHEENGTKPEQPVQGVQYFFVLPLLGWDGIISGPVWNLIRCIIYSIKYAQFLRLIYPFKIRSEIQYNSRAFAAVCFSNHHLLPPLPHTPSTPSPTVTSVTNGGSVDKERWGQRKTKFHSTFPRLTPQ